MMFYKKSLFVVLLFLVVVDFNVVVDARKRKFSKKSKSSKSIIDVDVDVNCSNSDSKSSKKNKGAVTRRQRIFKKYDFREGTNIIRGGLYSLLTPPPKLFLLSEFYTTNGQCFEDNGYFCLQKCESNELPDCTVVTVLNYLQLQDPFFECRFYNGNIENQPVFTDEFERPQIFYNTYTLKSLPTPSVFNASVIAGPGSSDFNTYIFPAIFCVATKGTFNPALFNITAAVVCEECTTVFLRNLVIGTGVSGCDFTAKNVCTDGLLVGGQDSACGDVCGSVVGCDEFVRTGALATVGQSPVPVDDGQEFGCLTRDVYDPQEEAVLPEYTCPPGINVIDLNLDV